MLDTVGARRLFLLVATVSGVAALMVQVVWQRMLHRMVGSTSGSVSLTVGAFLGGMALGALAIERFGRTRGRAQALRDYALGEVCAVGSTLVFPLIVESALLDALGSPELALALVLPLLAAPWGALFPLATRALGGSLAPERDVRLVYGLNALGSAAGALAVGFLSIPALGESGSLAVAVALELSAALGALALASRRGRGPADVSTLDPGPGSRGEGSAGRPAICLPALLLVGLSGFLVTYWEVLWTRILVLFLGSSSYAFSMIGAAVILGIGLGSLALGWRALARPSGWLFPAAAGGFLVALSFAVPRFADAFLFGVRFLGGPPLLAGALVLFPAVLIPSILLGSLFPWATAPRAGSAGLFLGVNCLGCLLGAFAGGPLGSLVFSLEAAYAVGGLLVLFAAAVGAEVPPPGDASSSNEGAASYPVRFRRRLRVALALAALAFLPVLTGLFPWDRARLLSGVYHWSREDLLSLPLDRAISSRRILVSVEGREAFVSAESELEANTLYVKSNGRVEGSVPLDPSRASLADLPTQILLGALPSALLSGRAERSFLVIGLGSGVTVGTLLLAPEALAPTRLDLVEIEPRIFDILAAEGVAEVLEPFLPVGALAEGAAPESGRLRVHLSDARRFLRFGAGDRLWDAVVSQPSEPWISASAPLFTLEFYELALRHLAPRGFFVQWLQLYKISPEDVRLLARTFRRVFPEVWVFRPPGTGEVLLLGTREALDLSILLAAPWDDRLRWVGFEVPEDRLASILLGPRGVDSWVGLSPSLEVNRDSHAILEFRAARGLHPREPQEAGNLARLRALGGKDPITSYLGVSSSLDLEGRRRLARRNLRLGDVPEAWAILEGDDSEEARALRESSRER